MKNLILFTFILISSSFLVSCGQGEDTQAGSSLSSENTMTFKIPASLQKHRSGQTLTAQLVVDGGAPVDLIVDLDNDVVTASQVDGLSPGPHIFIINYFLNGTLVATATSTVDIVAGQTTPITPDQFTLNSDLDADGVSGIDEVISGSDPNNPTSVPQSPNGVIDTPVAGVTISPGESVNFSGTATDPDNNTPLTLSWNFGGGATNVSVEDPGAVTFSTPGVFTVTFTVTDSFGNADPTPDSRIISVTQAPNGVIDTPLKDTAISPGESVDFTGTASDPDNNTPLSFSWDFDGGATNVTVEDPGTVTFSVAGTYTVTFTVTDSLGIVDPTPDQRNIVVRLPVIGLLEADTDPTRILDVKAKLDASGQFSSVTIVDVSATTPTLFDLQAFDALLMYSVGRIQNNLLLGDMLADYVDIGGGVVLGVFSYQDVGTVGITGRFLTDNYYVIPAASSSKQGTLQTLGTVFDSGHPIMNGVTSFSGGTESWRPNTLNVTVNAIRIADWNDDTPLVTIRTDLAAPRVDLGYFPPSSDSIPGGWDPTTDGDKLMANALTWASRLRIGSGAGEKLQASLSGLDEVPSPIGTPASGLVDLTVSSDKTQIDVTLNVSSLTGITGAHIHSGKFGDPISGPIFELSPGSFTSPLSLTLTKDDLSLATPIPTFDGAVQEILAGRTYVDVHTTANPGGEIRGQIMLLKPTFTNIFDMVFGQVCSQCHLPGGPGFTSTGLDLSVKTTAFSLLVNIISTEDPAFNRVLPGDPDNSYLIQKLEGTASVGGQMPLNFGKLSTLQIKMIRDWISAGALDN